MTKKIYVEITGGMLTAIHGDRLEEEVEFILRDHDNIEAGDIDPMPPNHEPDVLYW